MKPTPAPQGLTLSEAQIKAMAEKRYAGAMTTGADGKISHWPHQYQEVLAKAFAEGCRAALAVPPLTLQGIDPAPVTPIQLAVGGMAEALRELLEAEEAPHPTVEDGTVAIANWAIRRHNARERAREILAASPAQTGEPDAWQDPDCPRHVISKEDKRDFTDPAVNGAATRMNAERCTRPLFATRQTGGVDQAWVDEAEKLAERACNASFECGEWRSGDEPEYDVIWKIAQEAEEALRAHLQSALKGK